MTAIRDTPPTGPSPRPAAPSTLAPVHSRDESHTTDDGGNHVAQDQVSHDTHVRVVLGNHLAGDQGSMHAQTTDVSGNHLAPGQFVPEPHMSVAGGNHLYLRPGQGWTEAQTSSAGASTLAGDHRRTEAQSCAVSGDPLPTARHHASSNHPSPSAGLLALAAASLDDIERTRIAMGNRLRAMRDDHGLASTPEYQRAELIHDALAAAEHQAILELQRALRKHPLGSWVKRTVGIGEKQGARLLAALDDPYWNHAEDRPRRGPAELWAYCGLKPGQRRQKGVKSNWNAAAKMRARLCAESCIKQSHSPYRADYDRARANWADRDTSDMHKHNHALHVVAKSILRDLYLEGKGLAA